MNDLRNSDSVDQHGNAIDVMPDSYEAQSHSRPTRHTRSRSADPTLRVSGKARAGRLRRSEGRHQPNVGIRNQNKLDIELELDGPDEELDEVK